MSGWNTANKMILENGPEYLPDRDLLKSLLRDVSEDTIQDLMNKYGNIKKLSLANAEELETLPGIGQGAAARIAATFELSRRLTGFISEPLPKMSNPRAVYKQMYSKFSNDSKIHYVALILNTKNQILKEYDFLTGSPNEKLFPSYVKDVFSKAIEESAASIIIVSNDLSEKFESRRENIILANQFVEAGKTLGIDLLDHIIIQNDSTYASLKDEGFIH